MTTVPEPRVGERRRSLTLGEVLECVGLTPLGWAKVVGPSGARQSVPPELWAEYERVEVGVE